MHNYGQFKRLSEKKLSKEKYIFFLGNIKLYFRRMIGALPTGLLGRPSRVRIRSLFALHAGSWVCY